MELSKNSRNMLAVAAAVMLVAAAWTPRPASAQVATSCTGAMISSFTPCLNYLTGSSNGASTPTADCCDALRQLLNSSNDCSCLILTGNVPFSLPVNRALAISLPRACKSKSVPFLQCKGSATRIPSPGPAAFGPSLPPLPPFPPTAAVSSPAPGNISPPAPVTAAQPTSEGLPPLLLPSAAVKPRSTHAEALLVAVAIGAVWLNRL
uniref:Putative GPI-anchored protein At1g27950 n=1 Tax=Anthurium amnicola TaxID=1678845 RepID=A0A1D1XUA9_9ARAE